MCFNFSSSSIAGPTPKRSRFLQHRNWKTSKHLKPFARYINLLLLLLIEMGFYVAQSGLKLSLKMRMTWTPDPWVFLTSVLDSAVCQHGWFMWFWGLHASSISTLPTEPHPRPSKHFELKPLNNGSQVLPAILHCSNDPFKTSFPLCLHWSVWVSATVQIMGDART